MKNITAHDEILINKSTRLIEIEFIDPPIDVTFWKKKF